MKVHIDLYPDDLKPEIDPKGHVHLDAFQMGYKFFYIADVVIYHPPENGEPIVLKGR